MLLALFEQYGGLVIEGDNAFELVTGAGLSLSPLCVSGLGLVSPHVRRGTVCGLLRRFGARRCTARCRRGDELGSAFAL